MRHGDPAHTAARLLEQAGEILRRWDQRVRAEIPASREQQPLVLHNNLGQLLGQVARALSPTDEGDTTVAGLTLSQEHGGHRAELPAYSLGEVFLEYRLLRQTILEVLAEGLLLSPAEREVITDGLERAMQEAVGRFAEVQQEAERERGQKSRRQAEELRAAYDRERRIAQVLQHPLLLQIAENAVPGLSLATFYEPALAEAEVGGDFYDVLALPEGLTALVVGDTCGKGLAAAAHNTQVKDVLRAFLREAPRHPGETLSRVNKAVCNSLTIVDSAPHEAFIVLLLVVLDPASGEAVFASAGAEPLVIVRANGAAEVLQRPALPLGVLEEMEYEDSPLHLERGDTLVMVTDGITEARKGRGELLGHPGMVALVRESLRGRTLHEAGRHVLAGAHAFAGGALRDDACLVLARRR
jgi:serine phosphatase RsbU (regulator of sigma subunit)